VPLGNIVSKDDGWIYINSIVIFLVFFSLPENLTKSSLFLIVTLGMFILINKIAAIERLHKHIFFTQLIDSEIQRRKATSDPDYDALPAKGQEEVDKIDEYFHDHAKTFSALLILSLTQGLLILLLAVGVIQSSTLNLQSYTVDVLYLIGRILVINSILMYSNYHEIRRYLFVDLKEVYDKYSRLDGEVEDVSNKGD
jgi:hypothetical protein